MFYNASKSGPGPDTVAVICVYTEEHNMDAVGFKLIEMVQQDITRQMKIQSTIDMHSPNLN